VTTTTAEARRRLIRLKYALVNAYVAGATPEQIANELGRPWTPDLLAQCFPDVERVRTEVLPLPDGVLLEPTP
jgi:hypothetical protein